MGGQLGRAKQTSEGTEDMMYFWLIPLVLLLVLAFFLFRKGGTKRTSGRSRLDEARDHD